MSSRGRRCQIRAVCLPRRSLQVKAVITLLCRATVIVPFCSPAHEGSRGRRGQQVSEPHRRARTAVCSEPCSSGTATSWPASPWNQVYNDCYVEDDDNNNSNNDDDNRNNYGDDDDDYTAASSLLRIWLVRMMTGVADSSTASLSWNHHDDRDVMTKKWCCS